LIVEVIEFPTFLGEYELSRLIVTEPKILGDDVEVVRREFALPTKKTIDILARRKGEFLLVELKDAFEKRKESVRSGGIEQLKSYLKGFMQMVGLFGVRPKVRLVLVLAVSPGEESKRYTLDVKTGKIGELSYESKSPTLEKIRAEVMKNIRRSTKYHLLKRLEREVEELERRVKTLRGEIENLAKVKEASMRRVGDRFLYILPRFINMRGDKCFVCGEGSHIVFRLGRRKPFGLCIKHYKAICEIEEEVKLPGI